MGFATARHGDFPLAQRRDRRRNPMPRTTLFGGVNLDFQNRTKSTVFEYEQTKDKMETTAVKLYSLDYRDAKTYLAAALFVAGNIVLPQICHLVPQGGLRWLPIYFFTLVGAYKYGWRVGLLTALLSPVVNSALFGMPAAAMLPVILLKSVLLAVAASLAARRAGRVTLPLLAGVVLFYQLFGSLGEWAWTGSAAAALQDIRIGLPGMLAQVFAGYAVLRYLLRN